MKKSFKKLFDLLPPGDGWKLAALLGLMFIGTLLEVAGIGMLPVFVSAVSDPSYILENEVVGPIALALGIETSRDLLIYGGLALVGIFFVKTIYLIWFSYTKSKFVLNRYASMATRLYETYLSVPYTFHLGRNSAELIRNVTQETRFVVHHIMLPLLEIIMNGIMVLGIFTLLVIVEPVVTLVSFVIIGGGGGLLLRLIKTSLRHYGDVAKRERSRMIQGVNEGVGGFKDVTVMNRQKLFIDRFRLYVKNLTEAEIFSKLAAFASRPAIEFIAVAGMVFIAGFMIVQGREVSSVIPVLALFGGAVVRLIPSASKIIMEITRIRYYVHSLDTVFDDISSMKDQTERVKIQNRNTEKLPFKEEVRLQNVSFRYPNAEDHALRNISLDIPKGHAVGFVGESGAGKSTVVDVILGLLTPESGGVLVDGVNIEEHKREWQNNVGYIPQFIYLSDDTIRNNIAFGIPEEKISDEKIEAAVKAAQLGKLLNELPDGLDTVIGEDGVRLSGGQRQRIGIARALYDNPAVLIMDEATSALDNLTERQVIKSIEALIGERTIIMIAHRLTTVKNCDQLYLMEKGSVLKQGTYAELLENNTLFQKMSANPQLP